MIFYKPENSIRDMKPFWRLLFCHSKIVKDICFTEVNP